MEEVIIFNDGKLSITADRPQRSMQKVTFKYNGKQFKFPHTPSKKVFTGAHLTGDKSVGENAYCIKWRTKDSYNYPCYTCLYVIDGWLYYADLDKDGTIYKAVQ